MIVCKNFKIKTKKSLLKSKILIDEKGIYLMMPEKMDPGKSKRSKFAVKTLLHLVF